MIKVPNRIKNTPVNSLYEINSLKKRKPKLKLAKYEFFTQGHNEETKEKGWEMPAKGIILKTDIPMYMDGDPDIIKLSLKIGLQQEKVELLESIIKTIMNRGYNLKVFIEWQRFINGS